MKQKKNKKFVLAQQGEEHARVHLLLTQARLG